MGELIRCPGPPKLPGAEVDWNHLDTFEWTEALLGEYAERAAQRSHHYGGQGYVRLPRWPAGPMCQDCGRTTRRERRGCGRLLLCAECGRARARVAAALAEVR